MGANATDFVRWILDNLSTFIPIKVDKLSNLFKGNSFGSFIPFCRGLALYHRRAKRAEKKWDILP